MKSVFYIQIYLIYIVYIVLIMENKIDYFPVTLYKGLQKTRN